LKPVNTNKVLIFLCWMNGYEPSQFKGWWSKSRLA
jgi:hypothetical protein